MTKISFAGGKTSEAVVADETPVLTDVNRGPDDKDPLPCVLQAKGKNHGKKQKEPTLLEKVSWELLLISDFSIPCSWSGNCSGR